MLFRDALRRTIAPMKISAAATSTKIHSDRPVNGRFAEATEPPSRVVVPRTPPAGFVFVGLSVTTAPFTAPAAAGVAVAGVAVAGAAAGVAVAVAAAVAPADGGDVTCVEMTVGCVDSQFAPVGTDSVF